MLGSQKKHRIRTGYISDKQKISTNLKINFGEKKMITSTSVAVKPLKIHHFLLLFVLASALADSRRYTVSSLVGRAKGNQH